MVIHQVLLEEQEISSLAMCSWEGGVCSQSLQCKERKRANSTDMELSVAFEDTIQILLVKNCPLAKLKRGFGSLS